jgi:RNA polymerase sigma factor (sigma-70 family)
MTMLEKKKSGRPADLSPREEMDTLLTQVGTVEKPTIELPPIPDVKLVRGKATRKMKGAEVRACLIRAQNGCVDARNLLLVTNQPLIHFVARRYRTRPDLIDDMVAEGTMGLVRAIELFDTSRDVKFSTYAVHWIRAKISRVVDGDKKSFLAPDHYNYIRLDAAIPGLEDGTDSFVEVVEDTTTVQPDEALVMSDTKKAVRKAVEAFWRNYMRDRLNKRDEYRGLHKPDVVRAVIDKRLLLDEPLTLGEVSAPFGLSREAVRLVQGAVEEHLKKYLKRALPAADRR